MNKINSSFTLESTALSQKYILNIFFSFKKISRIPGKTSGGSGKDNETLFWSNPQFLITLKDQDPYDKQNLATVIVSLMQKYTREERLNNRGESCEDFIQFRIYRILNDADAEFSKKTGQRLYANQLERCGLSGPYTNSREVTKRFRIAPGNYVIIPSCYTPEGKGEFLLRIYTENPIGEANCCELVSSKPELKNEEIFFQNKKPTDVLFTSWSQYFGRKNTPGETKPLMAPSKIYTHEAFINTFDKRDTTLYKRITKTLTRRI